MYSTSKFIVVFFCTIIEFLRLPRKSRIQLVSLAAVFVSSRNTLCDGETIKSFDKSGNKKEQLNVLQHCCKMSNLPRSRFGEERCVTRQNGWEGGRLQDELKSDFAVLPSSLQDRFEGGCKTRKIAFQFF